jgi:hypothetical protein|tara:strand:- start:609 stop:821 length:213 start_codon:yes stop_codon:yes gene_type:complete
MDPNNENNKSWRKRGTFNTYAEALTAKNAILAEDGDDMQVKIRRSGPDGVRFTIKCWHPTYARSKKSKSK